MDESKLVKEIEDGIFSGKSSPREIPWKNLSIGIGVVLVVGVGIYFLASSAINSSEYKSMDLSTKKQDEDVAGTSMQGPFGPPKDITPTKSVPTSTPIPEPTAAPTVAPTSVPTSAPTAAPTLVPTSAPTAVPPSPEPTLMTSPTATPSGEPT